MANPFVSADPADDPLALFGPETDTPAAPSPKTRPARPVTREAEPAIASSKPVAEFTPARSKSDLSPRSAGAPADEAGNEIYPTPSVLRKLAAEIPEPTLTPRDLAIEVVGPPPPAASISFDHICSVKELGFVEGVALVQTTCDAVAASGPSAGVPELHGLFLTPEGTVVLYGPPTGESPPRDLALLLHQLVAPNLMPPAGRLFVGRWINNDRPQLAEFASELAYFARPNSRELLSALHSRCEGLRSQAQVHRLAPKRARPVPVSSAVDRQEVPEHLPPMRALMKFRKPAVFVAFMALVAITGTAIATLLSNPEPARAKAPVEETTGAAEDAAAAQTLARARPNAADPPRAAPASPPIRSTELRGSGGSGSPGRPNRGAAVVPLAGRRTTTNEPATTALESQNAARSVPPQDPTPLLPSRQAPDLKIYSANDDGVEPPRLRSAEIPELLIAGFQKKINRVELVISEQGEVQQVHMIGEPQRMPDVMLLSRVKQLLFDPAIRNGVPVRYRLTLSWNVTP